MTGVHLDIEISTNKNNYVKFPGRDSGGDNTYYTEVRISARKEMSTAESMA